MRVAATTRVSRPLLHGGGLPPHHARRPHEFVSHRLTVAGVLHMLVIMHMLIVEDEPPIAKYLARACCKLLAPVEPDIAFCYTLDQAAAFLADKRIDLCFLDLNLNGQSGFQLFSAALAGPFHTIVVSAYTDQAFQAFQHGVLDFIGKPFDENRLAIALQRYEGRCPPESREMKWLSVRRAQGFQTLALADVAFFRAAGNYVEAVCLDGADLLLDKTMDRLEHVLPARFQRIHRSAIVAVDQITDYGHTGGGNYRVVTRQGLQLPLSRARYKSLHALLQGDVS